MMINVGLDALLLSVYIIMFVLQEMHTIWTGMSENEKRPFVLAAVKAKEHFKLVSSGGGKW